MAASLPDRIGWRKSNAVSTAHHDVFAAIQRVGENAFGLCAFLSFARPFFETPVRAGEEVG